ncbi:MAG: hypothetical protein CL670_08435 [Balneola sp.]|jgi:hypothetical protein|nr:hypothetical protein [Balneola sp.]MBE79165.1 hypothetical protein [Balneola sp.]HBX66156.1 hypothetical protein [Balneolaceae bacterium]|tara:strand:+ start:769 stop:1362 length:594 start_codon:yes stop_codon:yes gene_type:complete
MNKGLIIKIAGFIVVPLIIMVVAMFFLYPYINKETYQDIVETQEEKLNAEFDAMTSQASSDIDTMTVVADSMETMDSLVVAVDTVDYNSPEFLKEENKNLHAFIDSLIIQIQTLKKEKAEIEEEEPEEVAGLTSEEFAQRIKSLLNLEEDDLAPILDKMTSEQLVRLYTGGGTIQREKILRSLSSDKAAKLMTEIML